MLGPVTRFLDETETVVEYEFAGVGLRVTKNAQDPAAPLVSFASSGTAAPSYLTKTGLLFAAISDAVEDFEDYFPDVLDLLNRVDFTKLPHRRTLSYTGKFNWKTMVDGMQS